MICNIDMEKSSKDKMVVIFCGRGLAVNTHPLVNPSASDASSNPALDGISTKSTKGQRKPKLQ